MISFRILIQMTAIANGGSCRHYSCLTLAMLQTYLEFKHVNNGENEWPVVFVSRNKEYYDLDG